MKSEVENIVKYQRLGEILRIYIASNSMEALQDFGTLKNFLEENAVENKLCIQTWLVLSEGNVLRYAVQKISGITMIDVNNIIAYTEKNTGLNRAIIKEILTAILYALGLPTSIAQIQVQKNNTTTVANVYLVPHETYAEEEKEIIEALEADDEYYQLKSRMDSINRLADMGVPVALYAKGMCLLTEENDAGLTQKGIKYCAAAAQNGYLPANMFLGDYYFSKEVPDFTLALRYYTGMGTGALNKERQRNVKRILEVYPNNLKVVIMLGMIVVLMFIMNGLMAIGWFRGNEYANGRMAISSSILIVGAYCYTIWGWIRHKYNEIVFQPLLMFGIFFIFTLIMMN